MRRRRYCFTLNNFEQSDVDRLTALATDCKYIVWGVETGDSGTPHLQGFVIFNSPVVFNSAKEKIGERAHLEGTQGTSKQAADYCKKDGNFVEFGEIPSEQGKRTDWDRFTEYVVDLGRIPSQREICSTFPSLYARYHKRCLEIARSVLPPVDFTGGSQPRLGWQFEVAQKMEAEVGHSREITFVVDPNGNSGKSWMCKYCMSRFPDLTQVFRVAKRDDIALAVDESKTKFLFDVPRGQMMFLQYSVLESLKDQMIFSPKYESCLKILRNVPVVIVFSNEQPDMNALTADRYNIINV